MHAIKSKESTSKKSLIKRVSHIVNRLSYDPFFCLTYLISALNPFLTNNYKRLKKLKNDYSGNRCFIMGNGPSLNQMPLNLLSEEYVWGLNRCYLLYKKITWRPAFYIAVDDLVVPDIAEELNEMILVSPETIYFFPEAFLYAGAIRQRNNVIWFRHRGMNPKKGPNGYFSSKAGHYIRIANTVTISAIQLAAYMGFNPIILIGCDTQFTIPDLVKTCGEVVDPGTSEKISGYEITSHMDNDPNHFDPAYFGKGRKWHAPNISGMLLGYRYTRKVCDDMGVNVLNATKGGKLEIFPRVEFESLFRTIAGENLI
jgi:hypothetical protein